MPDNKEYSAARLEAKLGFDRIRQLISDRCATEYAASLVEREEFSSLPEEIEQRLTLTDEMRLIVMFEEAFPTSGYIDCLYFLRLLSGGGYVIDTLSLGKMRTMVETVEKIVGFFSSVKDGIYPRLKRLSGSVTSFPEVKKRIDGILDRYGDVKDTASEILFGIRKSLRSKETSIGKRANAILEQARRAGLAEQDAAVAVRDGKFLIPVAAANKKKLPGIVYDLSSSGKTAFIEPSEIVELENEISELKKEEAAEIYEILAAFSRYARPLAPELVAQAEFLGLMDFILAKAQVALDFKAGLPVISGNGELALRKARHPLLEKALKKEGKSIVPLSLKLTPQKHILLISGPNAGGKSVALKTVGLLQYMFQWGMLTPTSETSELPVFERIMVSIGDDQSIDDDLSTYSSFLKDMKEVLLSSDAKTLVLIDELGSGTEPAAGGAIAEALLAQLDKKGVYGVITTHYTNLKLYASSENSGAANGAMQFDAEKIEPLFRLEQGLPGNSFAFELARKIGLPESLVKDAEERAGGSYVNMERSLRRIARSRHSLDERLQRVKNADKTLESLTGKYQKELEGIKALKKEILDQARREAEEIVSGANSRVESTIKAIKEAQAEREKTKEARGELQSFISALQSKKEGEDRAKEDYVERKLAQLARRRKNRGGAPSLETLSEEAAGSAREGSFKVGEKVRVKENGLVGEVIRVSGKELTLEIGNITSKISPDRVERISSNDYKNALRQAVKPIPKAVASSLDGRKLNFSPELDVRGERVSDAIELVSRFIDDAIMVNSGPVRIIHGKGTGALREEIQKYLRAMPGIATVKDESVQLGGSGVSVVTFL